MKILALEFSSEVRSVAVVEGGGTSADVAARLLGRAEESGGRNTRAFALIEQALAQGGLEREDIECIGVGLGPGSYTGIRLAISVAQGWQLARDVRVLGVNSVECLAWQVHEATRREPVGRGVLTAPRVDEESGGLRTVRPTTFLLDAQRGEFYCARYDLDEPQPRVIDPLCLATLDDVRQLTEGPLIVEPALLKMFPQATALCPDAAMLGQLAARRDDFLSADQLEPVYLRATSFVKAPPPRVLPPVSP